MNFLKHAYNECKEQEENFSKCKEKFKKMIVVMYCIKPKSTEPEVST